MTLRFLYSMRPVPFFLTGLFFFCLGAVVPPVMAQTIEQDEPSALEAPAPELLVPALPSDISEDSLIDERRFAPEQIMLRRVAEQMNQELERLEGLDKGIPSLFFTRNEFARLQEAIALYQSGAYLRNRRGTSEDGSVDPSMGGIDGDPEMAIFSYLREISLSGIVYNGENDWIIWLNKQRLTPKRIPPEIRDITVHKDYIELKWADEQNDTVVPIRLRPNQRFNLDSRVFLPG